MRFALAACAAVLISSLTFPASAAQSYQGDWHIDASGKAGYVELTLAYHRTTANGQDSWEDSRDVPLARLIGLSQADLASSGEQKSFTIHNDAGDFVANGVFANDHGIGKWTYTANASFAAELGRRGIGTPSERQQFELAISGFQLSTLDELQNAGFARPNVSDLARMVQHGVSATYITAMRNVRLSPKTVDQLIRLMDHGVSASYAADMLGRDPNLTGDDLVELRDHGVTPQYMGALAAAGYGNVSPRHAIKFMDHGVTATFIQGLQRMGYHPSPDDLVRLADHGVTIAFIQRMRSHGYTNLTADDLIRLRDSGF